MKSLMSLWSRLAEESADLCCTSATADINTVRSRVKHEGLSFLTITLPDFGKAIQKWLDQGQVGTHPAFLAERGGSLPRFLGGFFNRVFDRNSGSLLTDPCIDSIIALRQLTLMFGKIDLDCSKERQVEAIRRYVECENDVRQFDSEVSDSDIARFSDMSNLLFGDLFSQMEVILQEGPILPKHGPGSTADRLSSNGKYRSRSWTRRLQSAGFRHYEYLTATPVDEIREGPLVDIVEPGSEEPVRVALVPKTMKTPRVIAMEPTCMQYMQQALYRVFLDLHKRDELLSRLFGFDDQTPNQRMAHRGSLGKGLATLDLSDASDRVSNQLVRSMFDRWPILKEAVDSTRSRRAVIPSMIGGPERVIRLAKYASMGSALCFPIEAMVFTTLIFLGIQESLNTPLTREDVKSFSRSVRVYGDDIIAPEDHVLSVVQSLEHFGARVGLDKSFWTGRFRESCGKEYYAGEDVSIVRVRRLLPTQRQDADGVNSAVSLRNQLYQAGYWRTAGWMDQLIRKIITFFPNVRPSSPLLGRECSLGIHSKEVLGRKFQRACPNRHVPLVRGYRVVAKPPRDLLDGTGALLKCLLKLELGSLAPEGPYPKLSLEGISTFDSPEHLERSGRPERVSIKLGWNSPR